MALRGSDWCKWLKHKTPGRVPAAEDQAAQRDLSICWSPGVVVQDNMAANTEPSESWYLALLGFAEHFRTSSPSKIRLCVHCLQAVFQFKPTARVEARTHLQLGSVLYRHTKNSELAQTHLEKAVRAAVLATDCGWKHCSKLCLCDDSLLCTLCPQYSRHNHQALLDLWRIEKKLLHTAYSEKKKSKS